MERRRIRPMVSCDDDAVAHPCRWRGRRAWSWGHQIPLRGSLRHAHRGPSRFRNAPGVVWERREVDAVQVRDDVERGGCEGDSSALRVERAWSVGEWTA
jgi:hypothetical protein